MVRRYDPFRQMEAIFDDAMRQGPSRAAMPLDLYRDGEKFIALFDLPGVDPASVDIDIEDRTLTIRAERKSPEIAGAQWLTHERPFGSWLSQWRKKLSPARLRCSAALARSRVAARFSMTPNSRGLRPEGQ